MNHGMRIATTIALLVLFGTARAYDPLTHRIISEQSARVSVLNDSERAILPALGLGANVDDKGHLLPNSRGNTLTVQRLMQDGAEFEDEGTRAQNHFFDSQNNGRPLTLPLFQGEFSSPDWSLENDSDINEQDYSYKDAKDYFYKGLTGLSKRERDKNIGLTFETLGHVIHHLQDMSQPQHVRNDDHCDKYYCAVAYRPSMYESYTRSLSLRLPLAGYDAVDYGTFGLPRSFWENSGMGIAEFTSENFVSVGTNFHTRINGSTRVFHHHHEYPKPGVESISIDKRDIEDPDLLGPRGPSQPLSGEIWFIGASVSDKYTGAAGRNPRTSTYSIFDSDLSEEGKEEIFTLNRFNYELANAFLLPRAVGYSAGMINYFFRGKIEISPPMEGIFGVVDHAQTAAGQGFTKIKLRLKNATPNGGSVPQEMPGGTLLAVVKYIRNACYRPDLSGEFGGIIDNFGGTITPSGCPIVVYLSGREEISVSAPIVVASLDRNNPTEFSFDFSHASIPIDSRDVSIQVVYTGTLGAERDAVVVGANNTSEPTYLAVFNNSDYFQLDGQLYTPAQIRSDAALRSRVDLDHDGDVDNKDVKIDPEPMLDVRFSIGDHYLTKADTLQPMNYFRIAVLADTAKGIPLRIQSRFASTFGSISSYGITPLQTQLSPKPGILSALDQTRGVYHWFMLFVHKSYGAGDPPPDALKSLTPLPSDPGPTPVTLVTE